MTYINNCQKYRQDIIDRFEPAYVMEKFFSDDDLQTLMDYQFQNAKRVKARASGMNIQSVVSVPQMFRENQWLADKFTEALGEFDEILTGNFYITIMHHDAHVDLINEDEEKGTTHSPIQKSNDE